MGDNLPDIDKWNEFILSHPLGNIFNTFAMYEFYKANELYNPILIYVEKNNEIVGLVLGVIIKERLGFATGLIKRSLIIGGPIVKDNDVCVIEELLVKYKKIINSSAIYTQIRNIQNWSTNEKDTFEKIGYVYESHLDILHNLALPISVQLKNMHSGRRKNINKAERFGMTFEIVDSAALLPSIYVLISNTYKRIKLPFPDYEFFLNAFNVFKKNNQIKIFIAKIDDKIIAVRMVLCYKELVYDWYAGSDDLYLDKYPNDYLPWIIMRWASDNDYKCFSFGGAGKPDLPYGVRDYKLKFGGELVEYGRFTLVHNKLLMTIGKIGLYLYKKIRF